ncbi:hypothetical protein [Veronia pacifica]|uniref:hypothetical protein n=1 Tax=Veronia pacifica TaxID=1080227 RepID=UPI0015863EF0|nr:hypothetical protein [Veronia pacifica]
MPNDVRHMMLPLNQIIMNIDMSLSWVDILLTYQYALHRKFSKVINTVWLCLAGIIW